MYKVNYYTLAIMADGTNGNVNMGWDVAYVQNNIESIQSLLNDYLVDKKRIGVITAIERIDGHALPCD